MPCEILMTFTWFTYFCARIARSWITDDPWRHCPRTGINVINRMKREGSHTASVLPITSLVPMQGYHHSHTSPDKWYVYCCYCCYCCYCKLWEGKYGIHHAYKMWLCTNSLHPLSCMSRWLPFPHPMSSILSVLLLSLLYMVNIAVNFHGY